VRKVDEAQGDSVAAKKVVNRMVGKEESEQLMSSELEGGDFQSNRAKVV
jgi:hypothetical protein